MKDKAFISLVILLLGVFLFFSIRAVKQQKIDQIFTVTIYLPNGKDLRYVTEESPRYCEGIWYFDDKYSTENKHKRITGGLVIIENN